MGNSKTKKAAPSSPRFEPKYHSRGRVSSMRRYSDAAGSSESRRRHSSFGTRKIGDGLLRTPVPSSRARNSPSGRETPSARSSNRYEGLGDVSQLSRTKMRESRRRGESFTSVNGKLSLVTGKPQVGFDFDPPPPPPEDDFEALPPPPVPEGHVLSEQDSTFVDYTVVPLLLRSDMSYEDANKFGEILKMKYKGVHIRFIMSDAEELLTAISAAGIKTSDDFKFRLVADEYWKVHANDHPEARTRRTSFVYYREEPATPNHSSRPVSNRSQRRSERRSMRFEFEQERVVTAKDKEYDIGLLDQLGIPSDSKKRYNDLSL